MYLIGHNIYMHWKYALLYVNIKISEVLEENVKHVNEYFQCFSVDHVHQKIILMCPYSRKS